MSANRQLLELLRQAQAASRKEKHKSLPKRDYSQKEELLAEAIRGFRDQLWIGNDPSEPGYLLVVGPINYPGRKVALHFPLRKIKRLKLEHIVRGINSDDEYPA